MMEVISVLVSVVVLGILYRRMILREVPESIRPAQALVPIGLGMLDTGLIFLFIMLTAVLIEHFGISNSQNPLWLKSIIGAFVLAGLPEELTKFLMLLISILIFRKKLRNVYEYALMGAAVGIGFTIFEEFLYADDAAPETFVIRLLLIAMHLIYNLIMGYYLGKARYQKITGEGSPFWSYVLAFTVPVALHTLHDACTATNRYLTDEATIDTGIIIGLVGTIAAFILQIVVLVRFKKKAEKLSLMLVVRE